MDRHRTVDVSARKSEATTPRSPTYQAQSCCLLLPISHVLSCVRSSNNHLSTRVSSTLTTCCLVCCGLVFLLSPFSCLPVPHPAKDSTPHNSSVLVVPVDLFFLFFRWLSGPVVPHRSISSWSPKLGSGEKRLRQKTCWTCYGGFLDAVGARNGDKDQTSGLGTPGKEDLEGLGMPSALGMKIT